VFQVSGEKGERGSQGREEIKEQGGKKTGRVAQLVKKGNNERRVTRINEEGMRPQAIKDEPHTDSVQRPEKRNQRGQRTQEPAGMAQEDIKGSSSLMQFN